MGGMWNATHLFTFISVGGAPKEQYEVMLVPTGPQKGFYTVLRQDAVDPWPYNETPPPGVSAQEWLQEQWDRLRRRAGLPTGLVALAKL